MSTGSKKYFGESPRLSFAQEGMWFLAQLEPNSPIYNRPLVVRISGSIDIGLLERSINQILCRHDNLRAKYSSIDGQPVQDISKTSHFKLLIEDSIHLDSKNKEQEIERLLKEESRVPIDLVQGPLLRVKMLYVNETEYILIIVVHHIVFDAWSAKLFLKELRAFYQSLVQNTPPDLSDLPMQYADFSLWQRERLNGEKLATHLTYWEKQLEGASTTLNLPKVLLSPEANQHRGAQKSIVVPVSLVNSLKNLSQNQGATLFMTLLTAFYVLLQKYSGQDDIVIGAPVAGRTRLETEDLIGMFINTLVLRCNLGSDPEFLTALERVRQTALGALTHQDLPFEKLVEHLKPARNTGQTPFFQVMFNFENVPDKKYENQDIKFEEIELDNGIALFDLNLEVFSVDGSLRCVFKFNSDMFDALMIERMSLHYLNLLEGIVGNYTVPLSLLPLLTESEKQKMLIEWNNTEVDYPRNTCIHHLFELQVDRTPENIAVTYGAKDLSYKELNAKANQLAHYLRKLNIGAGQFVGVFIDRSLDMIIALIGVLKAGSACFPIDTSYPKDRIDFMIDHSGVSVLLTHKSLIGSLPDHHSKVICLDTDWEEIGKEKSNNLVNATEAQNIAYLTYTSGSTGVPKGVIVSHESFVNRLLFMQDAYKLTSQDRVLRKSPFTTQNAGWEFFLPLSIGARSIIARPGGQQDGTYLAELIAEKKITLAHFVPSMLKVFLEADGLDACDCLRAVLCDGEEMSFALQERFFSCLDAELYNVYGQSETCIDVAYWHCMRNEDLHTVPIGRPYANTKIYILDAHEQPVPIGLTGELCISGIGLAQGYLKQPSLTKEKFVPNPFVNGERLFKTGDLARYRSDGNIEFMGRKDNQVKIRGFRVEIGEVEARFAIHPQVKNIVVVDHQDKANEKILVAYVVLQTAQNASVSELRDFLSTKLPDYMVPSIIVFLDDLPLSPNGKINRAELPLPDQKRPDLEATFQSPNTQIEVSIARIWQEILGVDRIGVNDNFFELGGHSLIATQIISRLREALEMEIPLHYLFDAPTVSGLSKLVISKSERE